MNILQNLSVKVISVLTVICFISMLIIMKGNVNKYYLVGFIIMMFLMVVKYDHALLLEKQAQLKDVEAYFWGTVFIWDIVYILSMGFQLGRMFISNLK